MKIKLVSFEIDIAAWLVILAIAAVVITAVVCAAQNFQSLEMSAHFNLQSRQLPSTSTNLTPSTISTVIP
jgi:hypothetical protein